MLNGARGGCLRLGRGRERRRVGLEPLGGGRGGEKREGRSEPSARRARQQADRAEEAGRATGSTATREAASAFARLKQADEVRLLGAGLALQTTLSQQVLQQGGGKGGMGKGRPSRLRRKSTTCPSTAIAAGGREGPQDGAEPKGNQGIPPPSHEEARPLTCSSRIFNFSRLDGRAALAAAAKRRTTRAARHARGAEAAIS